MNEHPELEGGDWADSYPDKADKGEGRVEAKFAERAEARIAELESRLEKDCGWGDVGLLRKRVAELEGTLRQIADHAPDELDLAHGDGGYEAGEIARAALDSDAHEGEKDG